MATFELGIGISSAPAKAGAKKVEAAFDKLIIKANKVEVQTKKVNAGFKKTKAAGIDAATAVRRLFLSFSALLVLRQTGNLLIDFEVGLIKTAKTADLTAQEVDQLASNIIGLSKDIPSTTAQLLELTEAAGQLGVKGVEDLSKFTETVARLGSAGNISGADAAFALARISSITRENIKDVDRLASSIVALGNNYAVTERELAFVSKEIASNTAVFGVAAKDANAIAAVMKQLGVRAELAGSSVGRAFRSINDAITQGGEKAEFLSLITGKSIDEFRRIWEQDATAGFVLYLKAVDKAIKETGDITTVLKKFSLNSEELFRSLPKLASNVDVLTGAINLSRTAYDENTALLIESERAYSTLGSRISIFFNTIKAGILQLKDINGPLADFVDEATSAARFLLGLSNAGEKLSTTAKVLIGALAVISGILAAIASAAVIGTIVAAIPTIVVGIKALAIALGGIVSLLPAMIAIGVNILIWKTALEKLSTVTFKVGNEIVSFKDVVIGVFTEIKDATILIGIGLKEVFMNRVLPALKDFALASADVLKELFEFTKMSVISLTKGATTAITTVFNVLRVSVNSGIRLFASFAKGIERIFRTIEGVARAAFDLLADPSNIQKGARFAEELTKFLKGPDTATSFINGFTKEFDQNRDYIQTAVDSGKEFTKELVQSAIDGLANESEALQAGVQKLFDLATGETNVLELAVRVRRERGIDDFLEAVEKIPDGALLPIQNLSEGIKTVGNEALVAKGKLNLLNGETQKAVDFIRKSLIEGQTELKLVGLTSEARERAAKVTKFQAAASVVLGNNIKLVNVFTKQYVDLLTEIEERQKAFEASEELTKLNEELQTNLAVSRLLTKDREDAIKVQEVYNKALVAFRGDATKAAEEALKFEQTLDQIAQNDKIIEFAETFGDAFGKALEDIIFQVKSLEDAFLEFYKVIARQVVQQLAIQPLSNALSGVVGNIGTSLFSGGAPGGNPSSFVPGVGGVAGFASGGVFSSPVGLSFPGGKTGVMAEAGPEAIMPLSRGPNGQLGVKVMNGGSNSQTNVLVTNNFVMPNVRNNKDFDRSSDQIAKKFKKSIGDAR